MHEVNICSAGIDEKNALNYLSEAGELQLVKFLIQNKNVPDRTIQSIDNKPNTILHYACKSQNYSLIQYIILLKLIDLDCTNADDETLLHIICLNGDIESTRYIMSFKKIDLKYYDVYGKTILHNACMSGNLELVDYLFKLNKFDFNSLSKEQYSPLSYAIQSENLSLIKYLTNQPDINL